MKWLHCLLHRRGGVHQTSGPFLGKGGWGGVCGEVPFHRMIFMLLETVCGLRKFTLASVYRNVAIGEEAEREVDEIEELKGRILSVIKALLALEIMAKRTTRMIGGNGGGGGGRMLHWILFAKLLFAGEFIQSFNQLVVDNDDGGGGGGGGIDVSTVKETDI